MAKNYDTKTKIQSMATKLDHTYNLMIAVVGVLFIGFAGMFVATAAMLWDGLNNKAASYQILTDKVNILIQQNDEEKNALKNTQITDLQNQIIDLKKKNAYLK